MENNQKELILLKDLGNLFLNENSKRKRRYGLYKCFCGNEFKALVNSVKIGDTKSCGCLRGINHNLSSHKLYKVWANMKNRCSNINNKKYKDYGGRGITVCDRWLNVANFIEDMYPTFIEGLTLDRIDNNKGYYKENCRWTTKDVQSQNTRKIYNHNTSGYRGVYWHKDNKKWIAQIRVNDKVKNIGSFINKIDAIKAYDNYVIANNLEHTRNFN